MRILSCKVNLIICIDKESAIRDTEDFLSLAYYDFRYFFESFSEKLPLETSLSILIISQRKSLSITVNTDDTTTSTGEAYDVC